MLCLPDNNDDGEAIASMPYEDHAPGIAAHLNGD